MFKATEGPYGEDSKPRVTHSPEAIWLVYGDLERDDTHASCCAMGDVGLCEQPQFDSDVRYTRTDLVAERVRAAVAAERERSKPPAGWVLMPLNLTDEEAVYAQGAMMDASWCAVTCFVARYEAAIRATKQRRDALGA